MLGTIANAETLVDRALVTEYLARDSVVENANVGVAGEVVIAERSPGEQRDAESVKVIGAGGALNRYSRSFRVLRIRSRSVCVWPPSGRRLTTGCGLHSRDGLDVVDEAPTSIAILRGPYHRVWRDRRRNGHPERGSARNPGSVARTLTKLRISRPAETSSTTVQAISAQMRRSRSRECDTGPR